MEKRASKGLARSRARIARRPPSLKKRIKTFLALASLTFLSVLAVLVIFFTIVFVQVNRSLPSLPEIGNFKPAEGTVIYYADGPVMAVLATEDRQPVKLNQVSKGLVDATIATEDARFYEHSGVDLHGIARAVFRNVSGGDLTGQGASTITQQLARNISELGLSREKKFQRKVAEAILAMRIEQAFTKDEILELYLNQIYYGNGAYGVEAAARAYFHKSAKDLTLGEAAMLAGLPQRPSLYAVNHEAAVRRRDWVLQRMLDTGKIDLAQFEDAHKHEERMYKAQPHGSTIKGAPYFVNYVVGQLVREYGTDAVYSGYKIYTTLDSRIQKAAEQALREGVEKYGGSANQAALVSIDPRTGYIRAMVGGLDFKRQQFNIVTSGNRQPGSSFKPIVYTAALDTGVCDLDKTYVDDPYFPGRHEGNTWLPKNYSGKYSNRGMSVREAIAHSVNTVAVKVAMDTGLQTVIGYAHRMGLTSEIDAYPTLALGAFKSGVRPLELCSAYSIFANDGKRAIPMSVTRILQPNGEIIEENSVKVDDPGLKAETLRQMNEALEGVVKNGTGTAAADVPGAHGKTGTTSDCRDAWFAGYTPELTTVIWAGREQRNKQGRAVKYLEMPGGTGGHVCTPMWRDFMLKAIPIQQEVNRASSRPQAAEAPAGENQDKKPRERSDKLPTEPTGAQPNPAAADPNAGDGGALQQPTGTDGAPTPDEPRVTQPDGLSNPAGASPDVTQTEPVAPVHPTPAPTRANDGGARPPAPSVRANTDDDMVTVTLCADSLRRANQWCPATITRRMRRSEIPGTCRIHRAPPGEQ